MMRDREPRSRENTLSLPLSLSLCLSGSLSVCLSVCLSGSPPPPVFEFRRCFAPPCLFIRCPQTDPRGERSQWRVFLTMCEARREQPSRWRPANCAAVGHGTGPTSDSYTVVVVFIATFYNFRYILCSGAALVLLLANSKETKSKISRKQTSFVVF